MVRAVETLRGVCGWTFDSDIKRANAALSDISCTLTATVWVLKRIKDNKDKLGGDTARVHRREVADRPKWHLRQSPELSI